MIPEGEDVADVGQRADHVDPLVFAVRNAKQAAHYYSTAFSTRRVAYRGPETGCPHEAAHVLETGSARFVFRGLARPGTRLGMRVAAHGHGVADLALEVSWAEDLRENGGYHAAKDEQGQIEARIITLQHILENARVGGPPRTDGVVGPGMTVTIRFVKDDDEVTFLLASREESGSPIDVYSPRSPLGAAIMGKKVGEKATYSLPNGRASTVEILEAVPYIGA